MKKVIFRVDSSTEIGYGHVSRCLALASGLRRRGWAIEFLCRALPGHAGGLIAGARFPLTLVSEAVELKRLRAALAGGAALAVDSNSIRAPYHRAVRDRAGLIIAVDDNGLGRFDCDILVNHNIYASPRMYDGKTPEGTSFLLGPSYALLRPQFTPRARRAAAHGRVRRVLVMMGGTDPHNVLLKTLEALALVGQPGLRTEVVLGAGNPHEASLRRFPNARVHRGVSDMAALMRGCDLAVAGAGVSALELAFVGVPAALVIVAPDQRRNARAMARFGAAVNLGWHERLSPRRMAREFGDLVMSPARRRALARRAAKLVDGRGVDRICDEISRRRSQ